MSKKRFTMCYEQNDINGWTMSIIDWETKEPFNYTTYEVHSSSITDTKDEMEDLCLLLNELHEENERLKEYNNKLMKQPLLFDVQTIPNTMEIMEANNKLEEENEQLKQRIKVLEDSGDGLAGTIAHFDLDEVMLK